MIAAAHHLGYDLSAHRGVQVTTGLLDWADLVLAMDTAILRELQALTGNHVHGELRLYLDGRDVPDPLGHPDAAFAACAALITTAVPRLHTGAR